MAFSLLSSDSDHIRIFWRRADGSTPAEELVSGTRAAPQARSFTPDNSLLVYRRMDPTTGFDIWAKRLQPASESYPLLAER